VSRQTGYDYATCEAGASKGIPGDAKCVTIILGGTKIRTWGDKVYLLVIKYPTVSTAAILTNIYSYESVFGINNCQQYYGKVKVAFVIVECGP